MSGQEFGEFAGAPLALGSVHGVRQWNADTLGRLIGLSYPKVWTPGENVAECPKTRQTEACKAKKCGKDHPAQAAEPGYLFLNYSVVLGPNGTLKTVPPHCTEPAPCSGVDPSCNCGFWAYYDDSRWTERSIARGVIEGYGPTTVGTKGFRCQKARILALTLSHKKRDAERVKLIRRNYPDVTFYDTAAEMLEAFPLVTAGKPTPETDPEFWTRPADKPLDPPTHLYWPTGNEVDR